MKNLIGRRDVMIGAAAVGTASLLPSFAFGQKVPEDGKMIFDIFRNGSSPIGQHELVFRNKDGRLLIDNTLDISVKVAGITAFGIKGVFRELWQGDRLIALKSNVKENGKPYRLEAQAFGDKLRVMSSKSGDFDAPGNIMPTSYWNIGVVQRDTLLDPMKGRVLSVATKPVGRKKMQITQQQVTATRFDMQGDLKTSIWYSQAREWIGLDFKAKGQHIAYKRVS